MVLALIYRKKEVKRKKGYRIKFETYNPRTNIRMQNVEEKEPNNVLFKVQMYIISLWLLFLLIIPITFQYPRNELGKVFLWQDVMWIFCKRNMIPISCCVMLIIGCILLIQLKYRWKGTRDLPIQVQEVESENFEYLTFLTTYIIPLVCINLDEFRYVIVLVILLLIIGVIFVKSDFYLGNPTLALMGYKLYRVQYNKDGKIEKKRIITKDTIYPGVSIEAVPFDKNTWYVRRYR